MSLAFALFGAIHSKVLLRRYAHNPENDAASEFVIFLFTSAHPIKQSISLDPAAGTAELID